MVLGDNLTTAGMAGGVGLMATQAMTWAGSKAGVIGREASEYVARHIPGAGNAVGATLAVGQLANGDKVGAAMTGLSTLVMNEPGYGTVASVAIDVVQAGLQMTGGMDKLNANFGGETPQNPTAKTATLSAQGINANGTVTPKDHRASNPIVDGAKNLANNAVGVVSSIFGGTEANADNLPFDKGQVQPKAQNAQPQGIDRLTSFAKDTLHSVESAVGFGTVQPTTITPTAQTYQAPVNAAPVYQQPVQHQATTVASNAQPTTITPTAQTYQAPVNAAPVYQQPVNHAAAQKQSQAIADLSEAIEGLKAESSAEIDTIKLRPGK